MSGIRRRRATPASRLQQQALIPVWSAGETNAASLQVARKLGFAEVSRRIYLIPKKDQAARSRPSDP